MRQGYGSSFAFAGIRPFSRWIKIVNLLQPEDHAAAQRHSPAHQLPARQALGVEGWMID
jgi:hypothetical protein